MSITLNSKVFEVTRRPSDSSAILTTYSRGVLLPDSILIDHRVKKNPVVPTLQNRTHKVSFGRTYLGADGVYKTGYVSVQQDLPEDMDQTEIDGLMADYEKYFNSANTPVAGNRSALQSGVQP